MERRKGSLGLQRSAKEALAAWTPTPSARWALSRELSGPLEADHWAARALLAHDLPWGIAGLLLVRVTILLATAFAPALPSARVAAATPSSFLLLAGATARSAVRGAKRGQAAPARGGASRGAGDEGGPSCDTIPIGEPKLLEGQHVVGAREVTKDSGVGDVVRGVGEALIDDAEEVEHELRLGDAMANVAEGVGGFLHLLGVVRDGGVALLDGVELVREEDRPRLLVAAEEALNRRPEGARCLVVALHGKVEDGVINEAVDPRPHAAVCLIPLRILGAWRGRSVDVRFEAEFAAHQLEEGCPLGVVGVLHLQGHQDMGFDRNGGVGVDDQRWRRRDDVVDVDVAGSRHAAVPSGRHATVCRSRYAAVDAEGLCSSHGPRWCGGCAALERMEQACSRDAARL